MESDLRFESLASTSHTPVDIDRTDPRFRMAAEKAFGMKRNAFSENGTRIRTEALNGTSLSSARLLGEVSRQCELIVLEKNFRAFVKEFSI